MSISNLHRASSISPLKLRKTRATGTPAIHAVQHERAARAGGIGSDATGSTTGRGSGGYAASIHPQDSAKSHKNAGGRTTSEPAGPGVPGQRGRLYRQPARSEASRWLRHRTRSRPQDSAISSHAVGRHKNGPDRVRGRCHKVNGWWVPSCPCSPQPPRHWLTRAAACEHSRP